MASITSEKLIHGTAQASNELPPRYLKQIAKEPRFKDLLNALAEADPITMTSTLKVPNEKCTAGTKLIRDAEKAKRNQAAAQADQRAAKRTKFAHSATKTSRAEKRGSGLFFLEPPSGSHEGSQVQGTSVNPEEVGDGQMEPQNIPASIDAASLPGSEMGGSESCNWKRNSSRKDGARVPDPPEEEGAELDVISEHEPEKADQAHVEEEIASTSDDLDETDAMETMLTSDQKEGYTMEYGITMGTETVIAPIRTHCLQLPLDSSRTPRKTKEEQLRDVFDILRRLDFSFAKEKLVDHLKERIDMPGIKSEIPLTCEMNDSGDIYNALQSIKTTTTDAKLNRAYGQMKLASTADSEAMEIEQLDGRDKDKRKAGHMKVLKKIVDKVAKERADTMCSAEQKKIFENFVLEYRAGQKWLEVVSWFKGQGGVLIVLSAGITNTVVTKDWSDYQRRCLTYIIPFLHSIRAVVQGLGEDALEAYCRDGYLSKTLIGDVEKMEFLTLYQQYSPDNTENETG